MLDEMKALWDLLEHYFREARKLVGGLSTEQLNWQPISGDASSEATNSLYGIALHLSFVAMQIAARAADGLPPEYPEMHNGNNGILTSGESPDRAIELLNEAQTFVEDIITNVTSGQLEEMRERRAGKWVGEPKSVRWMMLHILEHTALHIGHMELTHQLVMKREEKTSMALTLTHVSLLVEDVPKALRFYSDILGLEVANNFGDYAELKANENLKLSLFDRKAMAAALPAMQASPANGHRSVIEFKLDALDEFCATLRTKGVQFVSEPKDRADWGIRTAYIEDPDGNLVNLYQSIG